MQFEFAIATRIIFGAGQFAKTGQLAADMGKRAFVVAGISGDAPHSLIGHLHSSSITATVWPVSGEPTIASIQQGVMAARQFEADLVIGIGGGSALDSAKAIAVMLTNPGDLSDYLEVVGQGHALAIPSVPVITIPTTAGTGSEVTRNAVIGAPESGVKVSLRSSLMLSRLALVDPELTYSLPPELTASTGLDALTQLIEPFVCNAPNPITDGICREGIKHSAGALLRAYKNGQDGAARQQLSLASLLGGLALANARLGAVHGVAGVLGGMLPIPHGVICARLLPFVMDINIKALMARLPDSVALARYREIASIITGNPRAEPLEGVNWVHDLCQALQIQPLGSFGLERSQFPELMERSFRASSMKGNPLPLMTAELLEILERAL
jgi:alcohol dehydrogenase class IV